MTDSKSKFMEVFRNADEKIQDDHEEDPFPAYLDEIDTTLAPFCPTSAARVIKALTMANVGERDVVVDLGSGDGRFVTAAVSEFNAMKAVGIESDSELIRVSNELSKKVLMGSGKEDRVSFILGDLLELPKIAHDIKWTVIVLFLLPDHTDKFADFLLYHYRQGARIVSLVFNLNEITELQLVASDEPGGIFVYSQQ